MNIAVIDLDGTVSDARHRLHLITDAAGATHDQWVRFFDAAADDPVLPDGVCTARRLAESNDIVWLTARPERIRTLTERWLLDNDLPPGRLLMKPAGDERPGAYSRSTKCAGWPPSTRSSWSSTTTRA